MGQEELLYALKSPRYGDHIAPLLLRDCAAERLSWTLAQFQRIDFTRSFDTGCRELFRMWRMRYRPAT